MYPPRRSRARNHPEVRQGVPWRVALLALLLAALAVRAIGIDWDEGQLLHPDEYHVAEVTADRVRLPLPVDWANLADPGESTLNPRSDGPEGEHRSFAYGSLPLYLTDLTAEALNRLAGVPLVGGLVPGPADRDWHELYQVYKVGRALNVLLDTLVVLVVFALARRIGGIGAGLAGATIYALAPMAIQLAHFYTTDVWLTFGAALTLLACARAARSGDRRWFALAGLAAGFTLATKPTGAVAFGLVGLALLWDALVRARTGYPVRFVLWSALERFVVAATAGLVVVALGEPYALLDPSSYLTDLREQTAIQRGTFDVPFTRVYVGTTPILYQAEQLVRWGMGPAGGLLALGGLVALAWHAARHRGATAVIVLGWVGLFLLTLLLPQSKFLRYVAPMVPALAVCGGFGLAVAAGWLRRRAGRLAGVALPAFALAGLAIWVTATSSVYAVDNTRLTASRWVYDNVPAGSTLTMETWDRGVPLDMGPALRPETMQYEWATFDSYLDRPAYHDALLLADALATEPRLEPVATAIRASDFTAAAVTLDALAPDLAAIGGDQRAALRGAVVAAANAFSPSTRDLRAEVAVLVDALSAQSAGDPALAWSRLAAALGVFGQQETAAAIYAQLERADYYVISSNRITDSVSRLPWRYPVQSAFFDRLQEGALGFTLVAEFTSRPTVLGQEIVDDGADETWINYDHPRVLVYQKTDLVPREQFFDLLAAARAQPTSPTRDAPENDVLLDVPNDQLPVVADARWSAALTDNSWVALAAWVLLLAALQVAGLPLARLLLGNLADGGWAFARLLTLLLAAFVVWLGASTGLWLFRAAWAGVAVVAVAAIGWGLRARWRAGRDHLRPRPETGRIAAIGETVFWATFSLFMVYRVLNPDSWHTQWGGEKPMEFAHLNATLRSGEFPPYDPWFSGGVLNYYYYGLYLVAFMVKLTGIPSEIAFNLAQPTVIALLAAGTFAVAATLGRDLARRLGAGRWVTVAAGLLGTLLVSYLGNPAGFLNLVRPIYADAWSNDVWGPSRAFGNGQLITEFPYFTGLYADLHAHVVALPITVLIIAAGYALAAAPRALPLAVAARRGGGALRVVVAGRLALLGLLLGTLYMTNAWDIATYALFAVAVTWLASRAIRPVPLRLGVAAGMAVVIGAIGFLVALPFYLRFVALFSEIGTVREPDPFWGVMRHFGLLIPLVLIGVLALLASGAPGRWRLWLQPLVPVTLIAVLVALAAVASRSTTGNGDTLSLAWLAIVGLIAVVAVLMAATAWARTEAPSPGEGGAPDAGSAGRLAPRVAGVVVLVVAVGAAAIGEPVFGLGVVTLGGGALLYLFVPGTGPRMAGLLVAASGGIIAALEVVYLVDNLNATDAYRMNTVFKFYNQVWVMGSIAAAALLARCIVLAWAGLRPARTGAPTQGEATATPSARVQHGVRVSADSPSLGWSRFGVLALCVAIGVGACYPLTATAVRLDNRFPGTPDTLDAYAWMDHATISNVYGQCADTTSLGAGISFADDHSAIDWFNDHVEGSPVIAEASIGTYRCNGSRFSISTGLPTVIGWRYHETQQRPTTGLADRERDVRTLYSSTDPAEKEDILRDYGVTYVVVGSLERELIIRDTGGSTGPYAAPAGLAAFDGMVGTTLEVAFQSGDTVVYRVLPPAA